MDGSCRGVLLEGGVPVLEFVGSRLPACAADEDVLLPEGWALDAAAPSDVALARLAAELRAMRKEVNAVLTERIQSGRGVAGGNLLADDDDAEVFVSSSDVEEEGEEEGERSTKRFKQ